MAVACSTITDAVLTVVAPSGKGRCRQAAQLDRKRSIREFRNHACRYALEEAQRPLAPPAVAEVTELRMRLPHNATERAQRDGSTILMTEACLASFHRIAGGRLPRQSIAS
jgi:hypothetical protein